jgi:hypothetical protein
MGARSSSIARAVDAASRRSLSETGRAALRAHPVVVRRRSDVVLGALKDA